MLKKTITYTNYNEEEVTEDFYFNLSKAECLEWEMTAQGSLTDQLTAIVNSKDKKKIIETFKDVIFKAYGEKTQDGKHFVKSHELSVAFSHTEAYSNLFMELATKTDAAIEFVNGIIPSVQPSDHLPSTKVGKRIEAMTSSASE